MCAIAPTPEEDLVASVAVGASRHTSLGTNVAVDWSSGIPEAKIRGFNLSLGWGIGTQVSGNIPIGPNSPIGRAFRDAMRGDLSSMQEKLRRQANLPALAISAGPSPQLSGISGRKKHAFPAFTAEPPLSMSCAPGIIFLTDVHRDGSPSNCRCALSLGVANRSE